MCSVVYERLICSLIGGLVIRQSCFVSHGYEELGRTGFSISQVSEVELLLYALRRIKNIFTLMSECLFFL